MVLVVTSPDSISIGMFTDFVRSSCMKDARIVNLNALLSPDNQWTICCDALSRFKGQDIIFRHKTRSTMSSVKVPPELFNAADCVIGFQMYSVHPEVLKSFQGWTETVLPAYTKHVDEMNRSGM